MDEPFGFVNSRHFSKNKDVQYNCSSGLKILVIVIEKKWGVLWTPFSPKSDYVIYGWYLNDPLRAFSNAKETKVVSTDKLSEMKSE